MASRPRVTPMGTSSLSRRNTDRATKTSALEREEKIFFADSLCEMTAKTIRVVFLIIAIVIFAFSIAATFTSIITLPHNTYYTPWSICRYENGTAPVNSGPSPPSPFFQAVCQSQIRHTMSETCNRFLHLSDVAKATGIIGAIFSTLFYFCALFMKPIPRESRKKKLLRRLHKRKGKPSSIGSETHDDIGASWLGRKSGGAAAVPDMTSDPYAITDTTSPSRARAADSRPASGTSTASSRRQRRFFPLWCLVLLYINFFMYLIAGICCTVALYSSNCADPTTTFAESGYKLGPCGLLLWIGFGLTLIVLVMERSSSHEVFTEEGDEELIEEGESEYRLEDVVISGSYVIDRESAAVVNGRGYRRDRDVDLNFNTSGNPNCDCRCDGCDRCCENCCDSCNNCCQRCSHDCSNACDCVMKDCECCCRECCQCCKSSHHDCCQGCCRGDCRCDCTDANCRACNCGEGDCSALCGHGSCDCGSCDCGSCDCGSCDIGGCGGCNC